MMGLEGTLLMGRFPLVLLSTIPTLPSSTTCHAHRPVVTHHRRHHLFDSSYFSCSHSRLLAPKPLQSTLWTGKTRKRLPRRRLRRRRRQGR